MRFKNLSNSDETEKNLTKLYDLLKKLNDHCVEILDSEQLQPDKLPTRKAYQYLLFVYAVSLIDGIISLSEKGQARAAALQARALWETWADTRFIYASRSNIWAYYLLASSEINRLDMLASLLSEGVITDISKHKQRVRITKVEINYIKRKYREWPAVPGVISPRSTFIAKNSNNKSGYTLRSLKIKDKCKIIDYYNSLYPSRHYTSAKGMTDQYDRVYWYYSNFVHVNPLELNNLFEQNSGKWNVDISGGQKRDNLAVVLFHTYHYHRELLQAFTDKLAKVNKTVPSDLPQIIQG